MRRPADPAVYIRERAGDGVEQGKSAGQDLRLTRLKKPINRFMKSPGAGAQTFARITTNPMEAAVNKSLF